MSDKDLVGKRFSKVAKTYEEYAVVQRKVAETLADLLVEKCTAGEECGHCIMPSRCFEIGCGSGFLTKALLERLSFESYIANDIAFSKPPVDGIGFLEGDAEKIDYPCNVDLIASASCVQWFEDMEMFFRKSYNALCDEGLLLLSSFGKENFRQFADLGFRSLDYMNAKELSDKAEPFFETLFLKEEVVEVGFDSPDELLYSLKATGVNAVQEKRWTKTEYMRFKTEYERRFTSSGKCMLTYNPVYLLLKKRKHDER